MGELFIPYGIGPQVVGINTCIIYIVVVAQSANENSSIIICSNCKVVNTCNRSSSVPFMYQYSFEYYHIVQNSGREEKFAELVNLGTLAS